MEDEKDAYNHQGNLLLNNRLMYGNVTGFAPLPWYRRGIPFRLKTFAAFCGFFYAGYHFSGGTMNGAAATVFGALAGISLFLTIIGD